MEREPRGPRLKRVGRLLLLFLLACGAFFAPPFPDVYRDFQRELSLQLLDRRGQPLRSHLSAREGTDRWVPLGEIPEHLIQAVLLAEDARFREHWGVDLVAVVRASSENLKAGRVVSGASTVTQQLLRTLKPAPERTWSQKLSEIYWACRLEWKRDKDEILEGYLNRVAFGPTVYGVEEASRYYFDKPAKALSISESSLLAVLIRAPASFDPFSEEGRIELRSWSRPLVNKMLEEGFISAESAERANQEEWELSTKPPPFLAPHFCDLAQQSLVGERGQQRTTVDLELQTVVEGLVRTHLELLEGHRVSNCAVVVAEVASGEVLALVGSPNYHRRSDGQHNAAISFRQPGSTLKPFTYALLLDEVGHPGSVLPDLPLYETSDQESFIPKNYDEKFHGPVSMRTALACSYNVPAVRALERVGVETLLELLRRLGMTELKEPPDHYGLGLTLGDGSVSLMQLVAAYRCLALGGLWSPLQTTPAQRPKNRILEPEVAFLITDVLSDRRARIPSFGTPNVLEFPFPVAVKTGTSKGYRDNWTVGYTPKHIVGVWVGNSDGSPMVDVSGITGAGPLFRDIMLNLGDGGDFARPPELSKVWVCSMSGAEAGAHCAQKYSEWRLPKARLSSCHTCRMENRRLVYDFDPIYRAWARDQGLPVSQTRTPRVTSEFRMVYPLDGDVFLVDPDLRNEFQKVTLKAVSGTPPYLWSVDGIEQAPSQQPTLTWPLSQGLHRFEVRESGGQTDRVTIEVKGQLTDGRDR